MTTNSSGMKDKIKKNKKVFICILSTIIGLVFLNIIISKVRVNSKVALTQLGMTEQEVINTCGYPTEIGAWSGSYGKGKSFTYSFPYCWDYVIWIFRSPKIFTNQKKNLLKMQTNVRLYLEQRMK